MKTVKKDKTEYIIQEDDLMVCQFMGSGVFSIQAWHTDHRGVEHQIDMDIPSDHATKIIEAVEEYQARRAARRDAGSARDGNGTDAT